MKKIVLIFLFGVFLANPALAGENVWTFCGPDSHMTVISIAVDPIHPDIVYIGGYSGDGPDAYRSTDGGTRWEPIIEAPPDRGAGPVALDPLTSGTLYIATGAYGVDYLAKSTDYGESWSPADSGLVSSVKCLVINPINPEILYAGVYYSRVFKSIDGGKSWEFKGWGIDNPWVLSVVLDPIHPDTLYISCQALEGYYGEIYKSTEGAESWELAMNGIEGWVAALSNLVLNPKHPDMLYINCEPSLYDTILNDSTTLYKTIDGAGNWVKTSYNQPLCCLAIDPNRPDTLFGGGYHGIYRTTDGGRSWEDFSEGLPESIELITTLTVAPTTPVKIYAGTAYRGVWCYTDTLSGVEDSPSPSLPTRLSLSQNYPNPFNANTVIRYSLLVDRPCPTTLKIYNISGQEVGSLVNEKQSAGHYSLCWDGRDDLGKETASGVYFYRLKAGESTRVKRMLLLR